MPIIQEILKLKIKPKEKIIRLAEKLKGDKKLVAELIDYYSRAPEPHKNACLGAVEFITKEDQQFADSCLEFVVEQIGHKVPRVKLEASCIVANVAEAFPERTAKAVPKLLKSTKHEGTFVRWGAAFALGEIAKHNPKAAKTLIPKLSELAEKETNNGVKNVYLEALKAF